jgi:hypothetical protein
MFFAGKSSMPATPILLCMGLFSIFCPSGWQSRFDAAGRASRFGVLGVWTGGGGRAGTPLEARMKKK